MNPTRTNWDTATLTLRRAVRNTRIRLVDSTFRLFRPPYFGVGNFCAPRNVTAHPAPGTEADARQRRRQRPACPTSCEFHPRRHRTSNAAQPPPRTTTRPLLRRQGRGKMRTHRPVPAITQGFDSAGRQPVCVDPAMARASRCAAAWPGRSMTAHRETPHLEALPGGRRLSARSVTPRTSSPARSSSGHVPSGPAFRGLWQSAPATAPPADRPGHVRQPLQDDRGTA